MLFSAGMGIGLVFWSVGEPMWHFIGPPSLFGVEGSTGASAQTAMAVTIFSLGFSCLGDLCHYWFSISFLLLQ